MADLFWETRFSMIICGDNLPVAEIENKLELKATRLVHEGDILNRLPEIRATSDEWVHTIQLDSPDAEDKELNKLLSHLIHRKETFTAISTQYKTVLRLYIRSDKAMIAYRLMPETL